MAGLETGLKYDLCTAPEQARNDAQYSSYYLDPRAYTRPDIESLEQAQRSQYFGVNRSNYGRFGPRTIARESALQGRGAVLSDCPQCEVFHLPEQLFTNVRVNTDEETDSGCFSGGACCPGMSTGQCGDGARGTVGKAVPFANNDEGFFAPAALPGPSFGLVSEPLGNAIAGTTLGEYSPYAVVQAVNRDIGQEAAEAAVAQALSENSGPAQAVQGFERQSLISGGIGPCAAGAVVRAPAVSATAPLPPPAVPFPINNTLDSCAPAAAVDGYDTTFLPLSTRLRRSCNGLDEADFGVFFAMPGRFQPGYMGPASINGSFWQNSREIARQQYLAQVGVSSLTELGVLPDAQDVVAATAAGGVSSAWMPAAGATSFETPFVGPATAALPAAGSAVVASEPPPTFSASSIPGAIWSRPLRYGQEGALPMYA